MAAFHTDYTDLQVQTPITTSLLDVSNAAAATIRGVEVEATTLLGETVQVGGHLAWLDARYDRYLAVGPGGVSVDVAGHRLNNVPEWSGRTWIDWTHRDGPRHALSLRADATWKTDGVLHAVQRPHPAARSARSCDLSAQFGPQHRRWSVVAYARNVTDQRYITGSNSAPAARDRWTARRSSPVRSAIRVGR